MPWKKVIWWMILLVSGLMAYVTYLHLAPMVATAAEAEAPAPMFSRWL